MNDRDKIVRKVKALLALAGNNPSEAEAASAAERAYELIAKHQIKEEELSQDRLSIRHDGSFVTNSRPWRRYIGTPLAELYFCRYGVTYERERGKSAGHDRHLFIGRDSNVQVCRIMFAYLCTTVGRLATKAGNKVPKNERSSFVNSFKLGCAIRLSVRLKTKLEAVKKAPTIIRQDGECTTLPALAGAYEREGKAVQEYFDKQFQAEEKNARKPVPSNENGLYAGYDAGGSIGLDQQLKDGQHKQLT